MSQDNGVHERLDRFEDRVLDKLNKLEGVLKEHQQDNHEQDIRITKIEHAHKWFFGFFTIVLPAVMHSIWEAIKQIKS